MEQHTFITIVAEVIVPVCDRGGAQVAAGERVHGERAHDIDLTGAWHQLSGHHAHDGADVNPQIFLQRGPALNCGGVDVVGNNPLAQDHKQFRHGDQFICRNTAGVGIIDQQAALLIDTNIVITQGFNPGKYL